MLLKAEILPITCIFGMLFVLPQLTIANTGDVQQFNRGLENFAGRLFAELVKDSPQQNIICSPFSIHTCLTMLRMGAEGETSHEMDQVLALGDQNTEELAKTYHSILAKYVNSSNLKMAQKIYAVTGYSVRDEFNALLTKHFSTSVDFVNFADNDAAAQAINTWVADKTDNLIKDLVDPASVNEDTKLVLVNAIHLKSNWLLQFPENKTREMDFYLDDTRTTKVQMMHLSKHFKYTRLGNLDAKALEMPYKDSDLAMLVILPNKRTGLDELEKRLQNISLADITQHMFRQQVIVDMPKFKAEFQADIKPTLTKMGMARMFTGDAEFGKMLKSGEGLKVSSVVHKAFIEVNERGTQAVAAAAIRGGGRSRPDAFTADRPFTYYIKNDNNLILFKGVFKGN